MEPVNVRSGFDKLLTKPAHVIFISFLSLIMLGTLLLLVPLASMDQSSPSFIDALFTATSATCVTGLVVLDTGTSWSLFGQIVILFLIQAGGLGLITLATFFTTVIGKKIGLRGRLAAQEQMNFITFTGIVDLIKKIIIVTFFVELIGAALFAIRFIPRFGTRGIYMSVFHSISSFNNAGFDIMGSFSSLTSYTSDSYMLLITSFLIIFGGLGFMVWHDVYTNRKFKNLLLHSKMVIIMTFILLIAGTFFFAVFEGSNMPSGSRILNSFFMSVSSRTAGFNTIDISSMSETTKIFNSILMFIGAAPGSTAGGIKVTTTAIILAVIVSQIKGRQETLVFGKIIPSTVIMKALTISGLSLIWVITVTTIILGIEGGSFIDMLYETVSAFGTVGLSTGLTQEAQTLSKLLLTITMFLGRIGPLTFAITITIKSEKKFANTVHPEGKIAVG